MIRILLKKISRFLKYNTPLGGSLAAMLKSFAEILQNLKLACIHLYNYYFNQKIFRFKKLNIGCGTDLKEGFCNIDLGKMADACFDVRNKMPFKDGSIEFIYSSHFVEHLEHSELIFHFQECYQMLFENGELRMAIPDFKESMKAYLDDNHERLEKVKSSFPISNPSGMPDQLLVYMDYLVRAIHEYGTHKQILDFEKIRSMLVFSGFAADRIRQVDYDPKIDLEKRKMAFFYVLAER